MEGRGGGEAPPWKGSVGDDTVAVGGVRGTSVVVGQLGLVRHGDGHRHVILTDQIWLVVDVVTQQVVRRFVGDQVMVTPTTGQAFHDKGVDGERDGMDDGCQQACDQRTAADGRP